MTTVRYFAPVERRSTPPKALCLAAALILVAAPVSAEAPRLMMSCHELDAGRPSDFASFYEVEGPNLYRTGRERKVLLSTTGKLLHLSRTQDDEGPQDAFATHVLAGHVLKRTVYWQRPGQPRRAAFSETYDFAAQTIVSASDDGEDSCHHDAFKGDEEG